MFFVLLRALDEEKLLSPHEETKLTPSDSSLRCSTTEPQGKLCWNHGCQVTVWILAGLSLKGGKVTKLVFNGRVSR